MSGNDSIAMAQVIQAERARQYRDLEMHRHINEAKARRAAATASEPTRGTAPEAPRGWAARVRHRLALAGTRLAAS